MILISTVGSSPGLSSETAGLSALPLTKADHTVAPGGSRSFRNCFRLLRTVNSAVVTCRPSRV